MKNYTVLIPITGYIEIEVDAEDKDSAIDKAFDSEDLKLDNVLEWEAHEHICEGNVFHGLMNDIDVI